MLIKISGKSTISTETKLDKGEVQIPDRALILNGEIVDEEIGILNCLLVVVAIMSPLPFNHRYSNGVF